MKTLLAAVIRKGEHLARKKIDDAVKRKVLEAHERGLTRKKISEECGISVSSVGRIIKERTPQPKKEKAPETGLAPEKQRKLEEIERRIMELEEKILYLEAKKKGR